VVLLLIKSFEDEHYQIPKPNPIDALKIKMAELGLRI
jgi:HTH-type transcriptional regulator / antitoxin HigA